MPPENDKARLEALVARYWFPLNRRCAQVLESSTAAEEVTRQSLARLATQLGASQLGTGAEASEWLEVLYRDSTGPCIERLTGRKGRDTQWLGKLERQTTAPKTDDDQAQQKRDRLVDLIGRTVPEARPAVIHRYFDKLGLDSVARLTGQTRDQAEAQLDRFHSKANAFLAARGDQPLDPPEEPSCPDALSLDRLLAGEQEGLAEAKAHLEQHADCTERLRALEQAREQAATPEVLGQAVTAISRATASSQAPPGPRPGPTRFLLPALSVALAIGLVSWLSWPETLAPEDNPLVVQQGYSLEVFVAKDKAAQALVPGETVPAGTELSFRLGAGAPMRVRLNALREQGPVVPIGPAEQLSWSLHPGELIVPPHRHTLGEGEGLERIFALYCPLGGPLTYLNQGLTYAFQPGLDGKRDLARAFSSAPRNCQIRSLILRRSAKVE